MKSPYRPPQPARRPEAPPAPLPTVTTDEVPQAVITGLRYAVPPTTSWDAPRLQWRDNFGVWRNVATIIVSNEELK